MLTVATVVIVMQCILSSFRWTAVSMLSVRHCKQSSKKRGYVSALSLKTTKISQIRLCDDAAFSFSWGRAPAPEKNQNASSTGRKVSNVATVLDTLGRFFSHQRCWILQASKRSKCNIESMHGVVCVCFMPFNIKFNVTRTKNIINLLI